MFVLLGTFSLTLFHTTILTFGQTDVPAHIGFLLDAVHGGAWPTYPLFHWATYALAGFSSDPERLTEAAVYVLTAAVVGKAFIVSRMLRGSAVRSSSLALALAFAAPIANWWSWPSIYLGQFSPNVWHNPSSIVATPFALLLYLASVRAIERPTSTTLGLVAAAAFVSCLAKPSFLFAFAPVLLLAFLCYPRLSVTRLAKGVSALVPSVALLAWQAVGVEGNNSHFVLAPLSVWHLYSPYPILSVVVSVAFPLTVTCLFWSSALRNKGLWLAWGGFAIAVIQFALLAESGPRFSDANLAWGGMLTIAVLFPVAMTTLLAQQRNWRFWLCSLVLALHIASGVFWVGRMMLGISFI